jgi:hypothetical protein
MREEWHAEIEWNFGHVEIMGSKLPWKSNFKWLKIVDIVY